MLEVSTPHLVQTFWGQNIVQCTLRHTRLGAASDGGKSQGSVAMGLHSLLGDVKT